MELSPKGLYQSSGKEKESCCLVFTFSTKREIRHFHVVVSQRQLKNVQKSVMHVESCCFAKHKPIAFLPFSLPSPSSFLKLPNDHQQVGRHLIPSTKLTSSSHKTFHFSYMKFLDEMFIKVKVSSIFKEKNNSG